MSSVGKSLCSPYQWGLVSSSSSFCRTLVSSLLVWAIFVKGPSSGGQLSSSLLNITLTLTSSLMPTLHATRSVAFAQ